MDSTTYIAVWVPIFIVLFIIIPQQQTVKRYVLKIIKNRRKNRMTNELILNFRAKRCYITTGSMGVSILGTLIEVVDNWVEVETKKGMEMINLDFVQKLKLK